MALSKTGRFLSKAEILGVGVVSPLSSYGITFGTCLRNFLQGGSGTELELETGTVGTSFPETESREEHSMDQYRSRLKLSENFERHWSIPISVGKFIWTNHWSIAVPGEIRMDQWS